VKKGNTTQRKTNKLTREKFKGRPRNPEITTKNTRLPPNSQVNRKTPSRIRAGLSPKSRAKDLK
jgi:hypothetical protein